MDKIQRKKATRVPVSKAARQVHRYSGRVMDKKTDDLRLRQEGMKRTKQFAKASPTRKKLKVKDMPRKQQMAVKASMAEQAAGKKSPAKMVQAPDPRITTKKKGTSKSIGPSESPKAIKAKRSKMKAAERQAQKDNPKEFMPETKASKKARKDYKDAKSFVKMKSKNKASALKMKTSPALAKLSASCKAAARRKFKVYPSAYANMWASRTQKAGKC